MHEARSGESAQLTLEGLEPSPGHGVGGRQGRGRPGRRGGGYLDECTSPDVWEEAKIRELAAMGLPGVWLEVVRAIGYEPFLVVWRILDRAVDMRSDSESMIEVQLRRYGSFRRYQRNRFIETLVTMGFNDRDIRTMVAEQLGEKLSGSQIHRLAARRRVQP